MKKTLFWLILLTVSIQAHAAYQVGDSVADQCWTTASGSQFCLSSAPNTVRVLLYNAGWCPDCNDEFDQLVPRVSVYNGKAVTFISLSIQGWDTGSAPNATFLQDWQNKKAIPFTVAASPNDPGNLYFANPDEIPSVVVIDQNQTMAYAAVEPGVDALFAEIDQLLGKRK